MKMINRLVPLFVLALAGCATTQVSQQDQQSTKEPVVEKKQVAVAKPEVPKVELPDVSLSGDMLHDLLLADIAFKRGHTALSVKLYSQIAHKTRDPRLAESATRIANYADMTTEALKAAELWVEVDPENVEARQLLTALLVKGGESGSALDHLEHILESEGESGNGFRVVASLLSRERDKSVALGLMKQLVEKHNHNPEAYLALSHLAVRLGEYEEAQTAVNRALELKPKWETAFLQYVRIQVTQGKNVQALESLKQAIEEQPDSIEYRHFYARLLMDQERMQEAYEQFKVIVEKQPENEDSLFALGFIGLQLNYLDEAENYFVRLKQNGGGRGYEISYYLGRLEELRGNIEKARRWYGSITQGEHFINAQIRIIALTSQEGDLEKARIMIQELKSVRPAQKLRLDLVEGEILIDHEKYEEAMALYNKALEDVPENADLLYARSMVAEKLGDLETLEKDLRLILARDPNNAEALNALGYTLADRTNRYDEAYELISRAIELRPNDYFILDSMGWILYKRGEHEEALKYLRRALDLKQDAEIAAHLGEVLWVMGDKDGAQAVWQKALEVGEVPASKSKIITEVMERLQQ